MELCYVRVSMRYDVTVQVEGVVRIGRGDWLWSDRKGGTPLRMPILAGSTRTMLLVSARVGSWPGWNQ